MGKIDLIPPWVLLGTVGNPRQIGTHGGRKQGFSGMGVKGRRMKDRSSGIWQNHTVTGLGDILNYEEVIPEESKAATFRSGQASEVIGSQAWRTGFTPDWNRRL